MNLKETGMSRKRNACGQDKVLLGAMFFAVIFSAACSILAGPLGQESLIATYSLEADV